MNIIRKIKEMITDAKESISILRHESECGGVDGSDMIHGGEHK